MKTLQTLALAAFAGCATLLAACGGGGGADPASTAAAAPAASSTLVQGTITGFGSVIIDGTRYDDSAAKVAFSVDPNSSTPATLADLKMGQRLDAKLVDGKLTDLMVSFVMMGPVDSVDSVNAVLVVLGQKIKLVSTGATPTAIEGFAALSDLVAGDLVKVAGVANADKTITATRIERKPAEAQVNLRVTGIVAELDGTAKTFTFGVERKVKVNFTNARVLPIGATIANGNTLAVYADSAPDKSGVVPVVTAKTVEVLDRKLVDGAQVGLGGPVGDFQSLAHFKIGEATVDAAAATLVDGTTAADVVNGARAYVKGTMTSGVLVASQLKISKPETEVKPRLIGQVTEFVSLSQFKLRGVNVDASHASVAGGVASDLANGTWLDVTGRLIKDTVVAETVSVMPPPAALLQTLAGLVRDFNAQTRTFMLLGVSAQLTETTTYAPAGQSFANLANERPVLVKGSFSEATRIFTVTAVEFKEPPPTIRRVEIGGVISALVDGGFKFGDATIRVTPNTTLAPAGNTSTALQPGVKVKLIGLVDPATSTIMAVAIEIVTTAEPGQVTPPPSGGTQPAITVVRFAGAVTDFLSLAHFRVAGQRVDASSINLVVEGGTLADIANGVALEVEGTVSAGSSTVTLRKVHFQPR